MTPEMATAMLWKRRREFQAATKMVEEADTPQHRVLRRVVTEYIEAAMNTTDAYIREQTEYNEVRMIASNRVLELLMMDIARAGKAA